MEDGKRKGIKGKRGFEIVSMEWRDGKPVKMVTRPAPGGTLRLRVTGQLVFNSGKSPAAATGKNPNPFYQTEEAPVSFISGKASIEMPVLKETRMCDIVTMKGKTYTLVRQ